MKLIAKYAKPVAILIVLCVAFLFGQAVCELALPAQMSNLVNVGLQKGGVDETLPEAVSPSGLKLMSFFMPQSEYDELEQLYEPYSVTAFPKAAKTFSALVAGESLVLSEGADAGALESAGASYSRASFALVEFLRDWAEQNDVGVEVDPESGVADLDITLLYPAIADLEQLPQSAFEPYIESARAAESPDQYSATFTQLFYKELGADLAKIQRSYILTTGVKMLGIALLSVGAAVMVGFMASRTAADVSRRMRRDIFSRVMAFSNEEFSRFSTASLITRTTNDVQQVSMLLTMGMRMLVFAPIMAIGGVVMALRKSPSMSWIIALAVLILLGIVAVIFAVAVPRFKKLQQLIDRINLVSRENLSGMMVIRAFGNEEYEEDRFDVANKELTGTFKFVQRTMALMMPLMNLILNAITVLIVWVGSKQIAASALPIGDMLAFIQYAMNVIMSFLMIAVIFVMVPRAAVSIARIEEVLNVTPQIHDPKNPVSDKAPKGLVEFKNVSFRYGEAENDVLHDINFTAEPGKTTAIIGSTGSGKSTLINLVPRFFDATGGSVLFDGIDVRDMRQHELRDYIGYVPQNSVLFSGDIESNLRYGKEDATPAELERALSIAQAKDFVDKFDDNLEHPISQGGTNVSGGQRQRLSIARAVVKDPLVYIFDDSFSALDFSTDAALRRALKDQTGDATVLLVAQRVSTILGADQIIVLDDGGIAGIGTHDELMENCEVYREIAESQLTKEEL